MEELKCKLVEYSILFSAKIMWGLDCELAELRLEIRKLQQYIAVQESLETTNDCNDLIPVDLIQKIDAYIMALSRRKNRNCRNCATCK